MTFFLQKIIDINSILLKLSENMPYLSGHWLMV